MLGRREDSEDLAHARMPERWPNRELIERAFPVSLDDLRADPAARLWGARVMVADAPPNRRVVGSIVFHGRPGPDGIAEIAYGVEEGSQRRGYATEAVAACVDWALARGRGAGGPGDDVRVAPSVAARDRERGDGPPSACATTRPWARCSSSSDAGRPDASPAPASIDEPQPHRQRVAEELGALARVDARRPRARRAPVRASRPARRGASPRPGPCARSRRALGRRSSGPARRRPGSRWARRPTSRGAGGRSIARRRSARRRGARSRTRERAPRGGRWRPRGAGRGPSTCVRGASRRGPSGGAARRARATTPCRARRRGRARASWAS